MGKTRVKIKKIVEKSESGLEPLIINFEHGNIKTGANLKNFACALLRKGQGSSLKRGEKRKQIAVIQDDNMTYLASSENPLSTSPVSDQVRTFIGVKRGKTMNLYESSTLTASPYFPSHSYFLETEKEKIELSREEKREAAIKLVQAFGSKKKISNYEKIEQQKVDSSELDKSMANAVEVVKVDQNGTADYVDDSILRLIPPCNRNGATPESVYSLQDIITSDELDNIEYLAQNFLELNATQIKEKKDSKIYRYSEYYFAMWNKMHQRKDKSTLHRAKLVLYTEVLIYLLRLNHSKIRLKTVVFPSEFPKWLNEKALENFTFINAKNIRCRPEEYRDKIICYIMVLVLFANNYEFDVQLMLVSLQIHIKKMLTLAKAVGITTKYNQTLKEYKALLKIPLPPQFEKRGNKRAR